jgi:F0F1-type ATP synthase membrane subunit a
MAPSKLIAGLIGPALVAAGFALLVNRQVFPEMMTQLSQNYAVIFLSGILSLVAGIAIVRVHNIWTGGWPVIITIFGWLLILGGLVRMWFPQKASNIAASFSNDPPFLLVAGVIVLLIGAFLSFKAYGSTT